MTPRFFTKRSKCHDERVTVLDSSGEKDSLQTPKSKEQTAKGCKTGVSGHGFAKQIFLSRSDPAVAMIWLVRLRQLFHQL
jgi:hypothetical protein